MMYSNQPTIFMRWATDLGCQHTADGLGMLVAQGALSFEWWFGKKPDMEPVYQALRQQKS